MEEAALQSALKAPPPLISAEEVQAEAELQSPAEAAGSLSRHTEALTKPDRLTGSRHLRKSVKPLAAH